MSSWSGMTSYHLRKFRTDLFKSGYFYFGLISGCMSTRFIKRMYRRESAIKVDENDISQNRQMYHTTAITRNKPPLHKIKYRSLQFKARLP